MDYPNFFLKKLKNKIKISNKKEQFLSDLFSVELKLKYRKIFSNIEFSSKKNIIIPLYLGMDLPKNFKQIVTLGTKLPEIRKVVAEFGDKKILYSKQNSGKFIIEEKPRNFKIQVKFIVDLYNLNIISITSEDKNFNVAGDFKTTLLPFILPIIEHLKVEDLINYLRESIGEKTFLEAYSAYCEKVEIANEEMLYKEWQEYNFNLNKEFELKYKKPRKKRTIPKPTTKTVAKNIKKQII